MTYSDKERGRCDRRNNATDDAIRQGQLDITFPTKLGKPFFSKEGFHRIWLINKEGKYNDIA